MLTQNLLAMKYETLSAEEPCTYTYTHKQTKQFWWQFDQIVEIKEKSYSYKYITSEQRVLCCCCCWVNQYRYKRSNKQIVHTVWFDKKILSSLCYKKIIQKHIEFILFPTIRKCDVGIKLDFV